MTARPPRHPVRRQDTRRQRGGTRGIATVEYLIVLTVVIIGAAFAAKAIGPHLVMMLLDTTAWLSLPIP